MKHQSKEEPIPLEELRRTLGYDKTLGRLYWLIKKAIRIKVGDIAGYRHHSGYRFIELNGRVYPEHSLIYYYHTGIYPERIDHINGVKDCNLIHNLRKASRNENSYNRGKQGKTNPHKGVTYYPYGRVKPKWLAQIKADGKKIYLGYFNTPEEAHEAYKKAADIYHGEFANYG